VTPTPVPRSGVPRRAVLLGGLAAVLGGTTACDRGADAVAPPPATPSASPWRGDPRVHTERVPSEARGRDVLLVIVRPPGHENADLPVCLGLHGRGGTAQQVLDTYLPDHLAAVVEAGARPFAVAAVDGGDTYWHALDATDDPLRMLTAELPGWLARRGLAVSTGGAPRAVLGISMGCFGALGYARAVRDLAAAAVLSPALFRTWGDASVRHAFRDRADWAAHEPLLHLAALRGLPVGVWCGDADPLLPAARTLARDAPAATLHVASGNHSMTYWRTVMPAALRFLGARLG
jgi:S-formylglutathione hydrolase FrmB